MELHIVWNQLEAIYVETSHECKAQIQQQLLTYCKLVTYGMVRL